MEKTWLPGLVVYWSLPIVEANITVLMNLCGALLLGALVGYERTYRSRAAGMRTYGLVATASAALVVVCGISPSWFGGHYGSVIADPTRVIQGILTGIGFLGAGVIMKDGGRISGLTTAASIWVAAVIGVLVGLGLYLAGILLACLSAALMMWGGRLETMLPTQSVIHFVLQFSAGRHVSEADVRRIIAGYGFKIADGSVRVSGGETGVEWGFVAIRDHKEPHAPVGTIAEELRRIEGLSSFRMAYART